MNSKRAFVARNVGFAGRALLVRLLPGAVTLLLPNPHRRFPLACGPDPETQPESPPRTGARQAIAIGMVVAGFLLLLRRAGLRLGQTQASAPLRFPRLRHATPRH